MKGTGVYLIGYVILLGGVVAALAKTGVLNNIGAGWTAIGLVIAIGLGIMVAVGSKSSVQIEK
ncbi:MAG: hypothetical protein ABIT01_20685 [Thermoanaerobaculia bacterium]